MKSSPLGPLALALALALVVLFSGAGCKEELPPPVFRVTFTAVSDGDPLAGVAIVADGVAQGETDVNGELGVQITGREGQSVTVNAECPEGYRAPEQIPLLMLRSFQAIDARAAARGIEMTITCPPAERLAAFVVRTLDQDDQAIPDLPITIRGEEVARTDASGVAHFHFKMRPATTLRISLDTSARDDVRPQNPGNTFTIPDQDEVFIMDQHFEVKRRTRRRRRQAPTVEAPMVPMRIQ